MRGIVPEGMWLIAIGGAALVGGCASPVERPRDGRVASGSAAAASVPAVSPQTIGRENTLVSQVEFDCVAQPAARLERNPFMKTLGGRQFWGDVLFFHGWRIQQNVFTKHYRLLDEQDYRHASGTLGACQARLAEIRQQFGVPPMSGKAVVFVHGIIRSSKSFHKMRARLEQHGYGVFGFDYPSTRISIPEAAEYLHCCLASLEGVEEIHLVVHSMGGLVVRTYLMSHADPRIRRMVMIGVPNLGAEMADCLRANPVFKLVLGPAGQQLVTGHDGYIASLPTPGFEFGILSGARGTMNGYNPLVPGDDDGTVSVTCTRLPGAADFITVRGLHSFLMNNDDAVEYTVRFLETGRFRAEGDPHPIPTAEPERTTSCGADSSGDLDCPGPPHPVYSGGSL